jgi:TatD DNase family protein
MLADTHCHLDMDRFDQDRQRVIQRARDAGLTRFLIPALNQASAEKSLRIAEQNPDIFVAIGIHPTEFQSGNTKQVEKLRSLLPHERVVAIGEIGLDYYWEPDSSRRAGQRDLLQLQLELAREFGLPVVVHLREQSDAEGGSCSSDMLAILSAWIGSLPAGQEGLASRPGVLHSFSGSADMAQAVVKLGFRIGITGPVTFPKAETRRGIVSVLPLQSLLLETDSPFLAPVPHRGQRNEPAFVAHIADKIAGILSRTPADIAVATSDNAARLFAWGTSA